MLASVSGHTALGLASLQQPQQRRARCRNSTKTQALFGMFGGGKSKEEKERELEEVLRAQQAKLQARKNKDWHKEVAKRRGEGYIEKRMGSLEPEPELPWEVQKKMIEDAARAAEAEAKAKAEAEAAAKAQA